MKLVARASLTLAKLGIVGCLLATLTGCGSSSKPATLTPTAAKNMYVLESATTNSVETDSVLIFPTTASGATTPASTLTLPSGFESYSLATGPDGKIYVGGEYGDDPSEILVFPAGASGSTAPVAVYTGGTPGNFDYADFMTVNDKGQLFIFSDDESVEVYAADAVSGDLPTQYITTFVTADTFSYGIGADSAGNIYLSDIENGVIDVLAAGATGAAVPARTITGTGTGSFGYLESITADSAGDILVANYNPADDPFGEFQRTVHGPRSNRKNLRRALQSHSLHAVSHSRPQDSLPAAPTAIFVFAAGASGNASPVNTISGSATTVNEPESLTTDVLNNIYYTDFEGGTLTMMKFPADATGNVAPSTSVTSSAYTGVDWVAEIAVY